jgi:hypothetical protein
MKNNVLDADYSMMLDRQWLWDAKVTHDWGITSSTLKVMALSAP